jgi:hypothetical protein
MDGDVRAVEDEYMDVRVVDVELCSEIDIGWD